MLSLKILNRLRLGREVAAKIEPTLPNHQAWLLIWPKTDSEHGYFTKLSDYGEPLIVATSDQNPLIGFEIIITEIEQQRLERALTNQWEISYSMATLNRSEFAHDEIDLETKLSQWLSDLSLLRIPSDVQYPFC